MRDNEGGASFIVTGVQERECHTLGALLVERRGRLVEQQQRLGKRKGGSQENTLALTARKLGCIQREQRLLESKGGEEGGQG